MIDFPRESSAYVGQYGQLAQVPILRGGTVDRTSNAGWAFRRTVSGRQRAQRLPRERTSWSVSLVPTPFEWLQEVLAVQRGAYGQTSQLAWVTPQSQVTNVMSLDDSMVTYTNNSAYIPGGGARAADGTMIPGTGLLSAALPVTVRVGSLFAIPPDRSPITASLFMEGEGYIRIVWLGAGGTRINGATSASKSTPQLTRRWVTQAPPAGAASASIEVVGAFRFGGVCATWTDKVLPYHSGMGSNSVVLSEPSMSSAQWDEQTNGFWNSMTFTVEEVG